MQGVEYQTLAMRTNDKKSTDRQVISNGQC